VIAHEKLISRVFFSERVFHFGSPSLPFGSFFRKVSYALSLITLECSLRTFPIRCFTFRIKALIGWTSILRLIPRKGYAQSLLDVQRVCKTTLSSWGTNQARDKCSQKHSLRILLVNALDLRIVYPTHQLLRKGPTHIGEFLRPFVSAFSRCLQLHVMEMICAYIFETFPKYSLETLPC